MTTDKKQGATPYEKIASGLADAIAFAQGDTSRGRVAPGAMQRLDARLTSITDLARTLAPDCEDVFSILADTERALKRAKKRMGEVSGEYERVELVPAQGAVVEFTGHLLRSDEFDTAAGKVRLEIWQTEAGALVAVNSFDNGATGESISVCTPTGGIQEQRMAVMEFFRWGNRARSMARKLDWSIRQDLD